MPAPKRNRYASKPRDQRYITALYVRLREADKHRIVEAGGDTGVAAWARRVLLNAVAGERGKNGKPDGAAKPAPGMDR